MWPLLSLFCSVLGVSLVSSYDLGHECKPEEKGESGGIRYYMDEERQAIYPFFYPGCGGEENNRFKTREDASRLYYQDWSACPGWSDSLGICNLPGSRDEKCPNGTFCQMGAFFGQCCSEEIAARYKENQKAICPNSTKGAQKYIDEYWKTERVEFGRNCTHNFCQKGAICIEEEFEAYCCLN